MSWTCVHQHNHKYFVQFIFWSCVLGLFAAATILPHLMTAMDSASEYPVDFAISSIGAVSAVIFFGILGVFLVILCLGLLRNRTTLEQNVIDYMPEDRDVEDYDLGSVYANFKTVFGRPSLAWVLPIESKCHVACSSLNVV
ncbi:Zinc finger DHHC domain containing protein 2 [Aphelenchoides avenae]|nr:Zinc finger DHHC domain containing protein 2 [Aphelenchus avenae]